MEDIDCHERRLQHTPSSGVGRKTPKQTNKTHHLIMNSEHYVYSKDIKKFNGYKEREYVPSAHFPSKNSAS